MLEICLLGIFINSNLMQSHEIKPTELVLLIANFYSNKSVVFWGSKLYMFILLVYMENTPIDQINISPNWDIMEIGMYYCFRALYYLNIILLYLLYYLFHNNEKFIQFSDFFFF